VENAEQLAFLKAHHCDVVQGYFIGKPVNISELKIEN
jgi:EAL domain-containing protein (putative c-di-GMP-specific phosphodiesterase class I)